MCLSREGLWHQQNHEILFYGQNFILTVKLNPSLMDLKITQKRNYPQTNTWIQKLKNLELYGTLNHMKQTTPKSLNLWSLISLVDKFVNILPSQFFINIMTPNPYCNQCYSIHYLFMVPMIKKLFAHFLYQKLHCRLLIQKEQL